MWHRSHIERGRRLGDRVAARRLGDRVAARRLGDRVAGRRRYTTNRSAASVMHTLPASVKRWNTKCRYGTFLMA